MRRLTFQLIFFLFLSIDLTASKEPLFEFNAPDSGSNHTTPHKKYAGHQQRTKHLFTPDSTNYAVQLSRNADAIREIRNGQLNYEIEKNLLKAMYESSPRKLISLSH